MKKTLITLIVAAFAALTISSAQTAGPAGGPPANGPGVQAGGGRHGGGMKHMQEAFAKLNLSDKQKEQVKDLFSKSQADRKALMQKIKAGTLTRDQAKPEMQALGKRTRDGIMAILTPEQKKQLAATMKEERKDHKNGKGGKGTKPGTPPPAN